MMKICGGLLTAVLALLSARAVSAQGADKNPLALVKTLKCTFPVYAVGSWKAGVPQSQIKQANSFR